METVSQREGRGKHMSKELGRRIFVGSAVSLLLGIGVKQGISIRRESKDEKDILSGKLIYSQILGWVDMGRANPTGARHLIQKVEKPDTIEGNLHYGTLRYSQKQKFGPISSGIDKEFLVPLKKSREEKLAIAFTIFLYVTRGFEEHQGMTDWFSDSAYSEADIIGNIIGFYRAVYGYSREEMQAMLEPLSPQQTLEKYDQRGMGKNNRIGWIPCTDGGEEYMCKYPPPFNKIRTIRLGKFYHGKILLKEILPRKEVSGLSFRGYTHIGLEEFSIDRGFLSKSLQEKMTILSAMGPQYATVKFIVSQDRRSIILYF